VHKTGDLSDGRVVEAGRFSISSRRSWNDDSRLIFQLVHNCHWQFMRESAREGDNPISMLMTATLNLTFPDGKKVVRCTGKWVKKGLKSIVSIFNIGSFCPFKNFKLFLPLWHSIGDIFQATLFYSLKLLLCTDLTP
jgi:hypothetical protein